MNKVILIGEIRIATGCVHQADFAAALGAERLTGWPKNFEDVEFVVGKLLAGRKPAMLIKCEKNGIATVTVESLVTPEVRDRLIELLKTKTSPAPYEVLALGHLREMADASKPSTPDTTLLADVFPMPPKRGKKKGKSANE